MTPKERAEQLVRKWALELGDIHDLVEYVAQGVNEAVIEERRACMQIAERHVALGSARPEGQRDGYWDAAGEIADEIRKRGRQASGREGESGAKKP